MTVASKISFLVAAVALSHLARAETSSVPRDVPAFELRQPMLEIPTDHGLSAAAGLADLGLRTAEGTAAGYLGLLAVWYGIPFGGQNLGVATAALVAGLLVLAASPALNAVVCSSIGSEKIRHPLLPLLLTSYLTNIGTDVLTIALLSTGWGAPIAYLLTSIAGSASMGLVHAATAEPIALGSVATPAPLPYQGPEIPLAQPQGAAFRF